MNVLWSICHTDAVPFQLTLESAVAEATKKGFEAGTVSEIFDFLNRCGLDCQFRCTRVSFRT